MLGSQFALQAAIQEAGAQAIPFQKLFEEGRELRVNLESMLQAVAAAAKNGDREAQERLLQAFKVRFVFFKPRVVLRWDGGSGAWLSSNKTA